MHVVSDANCQVESKLEHQAEPGETKRYKKISMISGIIKSHFIGVLICRLWAFGVFSILLKTPPGSTLGKEVGDGLGRRYKSMQIHEIHRPVLQYDLTLFHDYKCFFESRLINYCRMFGVFNLQSFSQDCVQREPDPSCRSASKEPSRSDLSDNQVFQWFFQTTFNSCFPVTLDCYWMITLEHDLVRFRFMILGAAVSETSPLRRKKLISPLKWPERQGKGMWLSPRHEKIWPADLVCDVKRLSLCFSGLTSAACCHKIPGQSIPKHAKAAEVGLKLRPEWKIWCSDVTWLIATA